MALNAHRVFIGPADADHYLSALTLRRQRETMLRSARDACREAIRTGLRSWETLVHKSVLFEAIIANAAPPALRPKFRMQGSFAYHTLNAPAQSPPQEIDLDDGVFVPVSFLNGNGQAHPALISSGYFKAVETLLAPVCEKNGWTLITRKPSCVRVKLDDSAHIDFALYAIPDDEFDQLEEVLAKGQTAQDQAMLRDRLELAESIYQDLREDQIMLAHREEGWKPSDPRKLEAWVRGAVEVYGVQFRRISRYLKGWRDHQWLRCRLSSIALMSCTVTAYAENGAGLADDRDDLALLAVSERQPALLAGRIENPVVPGQYLDEGWSPEDRLDFVARARELHARLRDAIQGTDSAMRSLESLTLAFGDRIPDDPTLIKSEDGEVYAPRVLTAGLIKQMGSEKVPQQAVKREGDRRYG
jgi:hypothetical protein